jgi:hypothetical protein
MDVHVILMGRESISKILSSFAFDKSSPCATALSSLRIFFRSSGGKLVGCWKPSPVKSASAIVSKKSDFNPSLSVIRLSIIQLRDRRQRLRFALPGHHGSAIWSPDWPIKPATPTSRFSRPARHKLSVPRGSAQQHEFSQWSCA